MLKFDTGGELKQPIPTTKVDEFNFEVPMLTPYWALIDRGNSFCSSPGNCPINNANRSAVFYQVYTEESQTPNATYILGNASEQVRNNPQEPNKFLDFSAKRVLVVTWLRLRPLGFETGVEEEIVSHLTIKSCIFEATFTGS